MRRDVEFLTLEPRLMLAGSVTVTSQVWERTYYDPAQGPGSHTYNALRVDVVGDDEANDIRVYSTTVGTAVRLTVEGRNGTSVNGVIDGTATVDVPNSVTLEDMRIDVQGGDDAIDIDGLSGFGDPVSEIFHPSVRVESGWGNDVISLADLDLPSFWVDVIAGEFPQEIGTTGQYQPDDDVVSIGVRRSARSVVDQLHVAHVSGDSQTYITDTTAVERLQVSAGIFIDHRQPPPAAEAIYTSHVLSLRDVAARELSLVATQYSTFANATLDLPPPVGGIPENTVLLVDVRADELRARLGQFDATMDVHDSVVEGLVLIAAAEGDDRINIYNSTVGEDGYFGLVFEKTGGGPDTSDEIGLYQTTVVGRLLVDSGRLFNFNGAPYVGTGNDRFVTDRLTLAGDYAGLDLDLGDGDDLVYCVNTTTTAPAGYAFFDLGSGENRLGLNGARLGSLDVTVTGGAGGAYNEISIGNGSEFRALALYGQAAANGFSVTRTVVDDGFRVVARPDAASLLHTADLAVRRGDTEFILGDGDDSVLLLDGSDFGDPDVNETDFNGTGSAGSTFSLDTGGGADNVLFRKASFRLTSGFRTALGDGDDTFASLMNTFQIAGPFTLDGGPNTNRGASAHTTTNRPATVSQFGDFNHL